MQKLSSRVIAGLLLLLLSSCTKSPPELQVTDAWLRPFLDNGAAFMTINNTGGRTDYLTGVECSCASSLSLHETRVDGELNRMVEVQRIEIPGFAKTTLDPHGSHVMLAGIDPSVEAGGTVELLLHFERSGDVVVTAEIRKLGSDSQD